MGKKHETKFKMMLLSKDFEKALYSDEAKKALIPGILFTKVFSVQADNTSKKNITSFLIFNACLLFLYYGQLAYFFGNVKDLEDATSSLSLILTSSQAVFKLWHIMLSKSKINRILFTIWKDFWPSSLLTNQKEYARKIILHLNLMNFFGCTLACVAISLFGENLFSRDMKLPYETSYPFELDQVRYYEILYSFQWLITMVMIFVVFGFDVLFGAIIINVVIQLQIIRDLLRDLSSPRTKDFYVRYKLIGLVESDDFENKVLQKCVAHHNALLRVNKLIEEAYSPIIFFNFSATITALCVFSILLRPSTIVSISSCFVSHLFQLYAYCYFGNELSQESVKVADAAFESGWHLNFKKNLIKDTILFMRISQKQMCLTAFGLFKMDFPNFVEVLKLSFSCYTVLRSLMRKSMMKNQVNPT